MWVKFCLSLHYREGVDDTVEEHLLYDDKHKSKTGEFWMDEAEAWALERPELRYHEDGYDVAYAADVKLPESVKKEMLDRYNGQIRHAGQMIKAIQES